MLDIFKHVLLKKKSLFSIFQNLFFTCLTCFCLFLQFLMFLIFLTFSELYIYIYILCEYPIRTAFIGHELVDPK